MNLRYQSNDNNSITAMLMSFDTSSVTPNKKMINDRIIVHTNITILVT